jgi:hypothetical protein
VNGYTVITAAARPDLTDAMRRLGASPWPEFLLDHDEVVNRLWGRLYELWPEYQFALADPDGDDLLAVGNCLPIRWDGDPATLPRKGSTRSSKTARRRSRRAQNRPPRRP